MALTLHNSLSGAKETFEPLDPGRVTMYVCGPTVYNPPHIGNARAAVVYDVLYRVLKRHYPNVLYVRNITDVDDKINAAAKEAGVPIREVTDKYTKVYHDDMRALDVLPPVIEPRATEHIDTIIAMVESLIAGGYAYEGAGHVLFHVPSYPGYGRLSGRNTEDMIAGARVEVEDYKRDPADFVLWKPSTDDLPGWDSPWGRGRPGWHIECSAMIERHIGPTVDIHGGGNDLKFPHHENELAQSQCAHGGQLFCRYWVHNGFVQIDKEKMSKSLGNVALVKDLLQSYSGEVIRFALIKGRYREPLSWSDERVREAEAQLDHLYGALQGLSDVAVTNDVMTAPAAFIDAMDDDLNTPLAISVLMEVVTQANTASGADEKARLKGALLAGGQELGILQGDPGLWFSTAPARAIDTTQIETLIAQREQARRVKDWATADGVRDELTAMGIQILDGPEGTRWRVER